MDNVNKKLEASPYDRATTMRDIRARYRANRRPLDGEMIEAQGLRLPSSTRRTAVYYLLERDELKLEVRDEMGRNALVRFTIGGASEAEIFDRCLVFRENPYQAMPTGKRVSDTLTCKAMKTNRRSRRNVIVKEDYVVVTPVGLDVGERVCISYQKSFLDRA